ncbi:conserved membrane hypothetical protein [Candidatus Magnetomoraceae bacterium gMMP-15]
MISSQFLTNPYIVAIGIPLVLLFSGAVAKKLVRGSNWQRHDFFLGIEFTLAAMSAALVFLFDLVKIISTGSSDITEKLAATGAFLALNFFLLLWVMSVHQDWEKQNDKPRAQIVWLGLLTNLVGSGLIIIFVLLVKGVN